MAMISGDFSRWEDFTKGELALEGCFTRAANPSSFYPNNPLYNQGTPYFPQLRYPADKIFSMLFCAFFHWFVIQHCIEQQQELNKFIQNALLQQNI